MARMDLPPHRDQPGDLLQQKENYGGLLPEEMWRPKLLEDENARLRKSSRLSPSIARLCRTLFGESFEAGGIE